jgi:hypothetical protein
MSGFELRLDGLVVQRWQRRGIRLCRRRRVSGRYVWRANRHTDTDGDANADADDGPQRYADADSDAVRVRRGLRRLG